MASTPSMASSAREATRVVVLGRSEWPEGVEPATFPSDADRPDPDPCRADPPRALAEPESARTVDVAIVGAGPSGLIAAYRLRDLDVLLLEREPEVGGNARADAWRGAVYPAGAIVTYARSPAMELYDELGLNPRPTGETVRSAVLVDGRRLEGDLWGPVIEEIYPPGAVRSLREARRDLLALDVEADRERLDHTTLAALLTAYRPEVKHWLDRLLAWFGCTTEDVSGYVGIYLARSQMGEGLGVLYPEGTSAGGAFSFPGGLSRPALALRDAFEAAGRGRIWTDTTVYGVRQDDGGVTLRAVRSGRPAAVYARVVIVAASKYVARRIVEGIPTDQRAAMDAMTYVPYLVGAIGAREALAPGIGVARTLDAPMATIRDLSPAGRGQLLRCEFPLRPAQLPFALDEDGLRMFGRTVGDHLERLFPGAREKIEEIRIWRRGHNWYVPGPGLVTRHQPVAARPLGRILFANADSVGPISEFGWALVAAERAAEGARERLVDRKGGGRPRPLYPKQHGSAR